MIKATSEKKRFPSWTELGERIVATLEDAELQLLATSMAFNTVLAIIPLLAVSLAVSTAVGQIWEFFGHLEPILLDYLATGTGEDFVREIEASIARMNSGALGVTGMAFLVLTSIKLLFDVDRAVQRVWGIKTKRPFFKRLTIYSLIIFVGPVSLAFILGLVSPDTFKFLAPLPGQVISWPFVTLVLFLLLKFVPNEKVYFAPAFVTASFTAIGLLISQVSYSYITANFLYYNKVYGSLASVLLFLVWILIIWLIFLAGNVVCVALNKDYAITHPDPEETRAH